jgi:hyperosmotically inducible protein
MKTLLVLLIGAAIGIGGYMYLKDSGNRPDFNRAGDKISESAGNIRDKLNEKIPDIDTEQIKDELARTGRVVQRKAQEAGAKIADVSADARITAAIKGKLAVDPNLSALKISVNTTQGVVTLAGTASSHEDIKRAMRLALEVDGATEVVSTLQVK